MSNYFFNTRTKIYAQKIFLIILVGFIFLGIFISSYGIWIPYSYWWDELCSVAGSSIPIKEMFVELILPDVHPPLYQLFLKGWIGVFSNSEPVTRILSLVFTILSFTILLFWSKKNLSLFATGILLVFFSTNRLFIYYAQESRSYAMILFESTLLTLLLTDFLWKEEKRDNKQILFISGLSVILSLTHYFGLIYAGLIILFSIYFVQRNKKQIFILLISGMICLIWPFIHYVFGGISTKMEGNFWIKTDGIQTTISVISEAFFPLISTALYKILQIQNEIIIAILFIILLSIIVSFAISSGKAYKIKRSEKVFPALTISLLIISFIIIMIVIDRFSPMSTTRNYIVLLPLMSIIVSISSAKSFHKNYIFGILIILILGSANIYLGAHSRSFQRIPRQNYKDASNYILEKLAEDKELSVYYDDQDSSLSEIQKRVVTFYLEKGGLPGEIQVDTSTINEVLQKEEEYLFFIQHSNDIIDTLKEEFIHRNIKYELYIPPQRLSGMAVFYKKNQ